MAAGLDTTENLDPSGTRKLLQLLGALRRSPGGTVIYRQIEDMLDEFAASELRSQMAYAGFVNILLDAYNTHHSPGSSRYLQIRLLQARLQPPLTSAEQAALGRLIDDSAQQLRDNSALDPDLMLQAIAPLLAEFGLDAIPDARPQYPEVESFTEAAGTAGNAAAPSQDEHVEEGEAAREALVVATTPAPIEPGNGALPAAGPEPAPATAAEAAEPEFTPATDDAPAEENVTAIATPADGAEFPDGQNLNALHRSELEARREDIAKLQATLGEQVIETITKNEEFGVVLEKTLDELRQIEDPAELENVRWKLIREVEKLLGGHHDLADKLDTTHHYLQLYESDSRQLTDELTRVRLLSLTDELTGLPNRRAFMRRLEDEVARVQRYGFPLSFVLIDLDHFKSVNDEHGHAAGDEVLRVYSRNILSIFRHHDMVARYGGEEFAVLLPNTDSDGTIRALNKVRRRAGETRWQNNGTVSDVPTFSAGVSLYKPGETAGAFIERADKALYRAKRLGRNRIELDMTYQQESSEVAPRRRSSDQ